MKRFFTASLISVSLLGILLNPSCKKKEDPDPTPPDSTFVQKVDKILQDTMAKYGIAGATMYVEDVQGNVAWISAGMADNEQQIPVNPETKFRVASISKTFLAVVVLQLMEEGMFALDNKYADYLADSIVALYPYGSEVTIRQLLEHTSGIYDFEDMQFIAMLLGDPTHHWTPWELLVYAATADSAHFDPPGTLYHYSNTNYILLGQLVEKVTGVSMQENIRDRVLTPLQLQNTFSGGLEAVPQSNYANGYVDIPGMLQMTVNDQTLPLYFEWAHGQMISTAHDLYIFYNAVLNKDLFQNQSTLDAMIECSALSNGTYGMGIAKNSQQLGYGHAGETLGFISFASVNPETGSTIVLLYNTQDHDFQGAMVKAIYFLIYPEEG